MPGGRPPIAITEELCQKAETLAAQGLTVEQIALTLGMATGTAYDKQAKFPEFSEAIKAGRAKGIATITNALFSNAKAGDTVAQKYYLNNRDNKNWKDRALTEHTGTVGISDLSSDQLDAKIAMFNQAKEIDE